MIISLIYFQNKLKSALKMRIALNVKRRKTILKSYTYNDNNGI
jgi:hypothetical protein